MKDPYLMDGHKLFWHPRAVANWYEGAAPVPPIHLDCGITKRCNIACQYCIAYTQGTGFEEGDVIPTDALMNFVADAGEIGVKSMAWIGDGEPTLHPAWLRASEVGKLAGIDMAIATNGIAFVPRSSLAAFTWARFNISAGTPDGYSLVHNVNPTTFDLVVKRIQDVIETRNRLGLTTTIGLQAVPMPHYIEEMPKLAALGKSLGVDYLVIKQCCISADGITGPEGITLENPQGDAKHDEMLRQAESYSGDGYNVVVKWDRIATNAARRYSKCYGPEFIPQLSGNGKLYTCGPHFGEEAFEILDITKERLRDVYSTLRWYNAHKAARDCNPSKDCNTSCRQDAVNEYLYRLKHGKPEHVNFV